MSIFETLIAIALLSIVFVSVLGVLAAGLRSSKKDFLREKAASSATLLLNRTVLSVQTDSPPGTRGQFWNTEHPSRTSPFKSGTENNGDQDFLYEICTTTIQAADGNVFGAPNRRLKQIDVYVHWDSQDSRAGYGSTLFHGRRLISEASGDAF